MNQVHPSCRDDSLAAGESLAGTAVHTVRWLLVEVREAWGRKGLADTPIPALARARVMEAAKATGARVQLIRQPEAGERTGLRVLGVRAEPGNRGIHTMTLGGWSDVVQADLIGLIEGQAGQPTNEEIVLICSHGRRDKCCSRLGAPIYRAFRPLAGDRAWNSSHLGGHRFAPTLVFLPQGLQYGRVEPSDVGPLWKAIQSGDIGLIDRLRGPTHLPREAQVAVLTWLRGKPGLTLDAITVTSIDLQPEGHTRVTAHIDGQVTSIDLWPKIGDRPRMKSCADPAPCTWSSLCTQGIRAVSPAQ